MRGHYTHGAHGQNMLRSRLTLQRHLSASTKFSHVESRFCSHKRPGKAVFYTSINLCVRKHVCRSVVVGLFSSHIHRGVPRIFLTVPLSSAAVGFHQDPGEQILRYGKLATSYLKRILDSPPA